MAVKYFSEFERRNDRPGVKTIDIVRVEISDVAYVGEAQELTFGATPLTVDLTDTEDNKLAPLKGRQYTMQFIATDTFSFNDLFTDSEQKWIVTVYVNSGIEWKGFIIPDKCSEPFLDPPYTITVRAIDGLGILKNIKYRDENGAILTGETTIMDIFVNCLNPLGLNMNINTFCRLVYDGLDINDDPWVNVQLYNERYQTHGDTITDSKSCAEVMESILTEWVSTIVQRNGEWYIYRIPDFTDNVGDIVFRQYDSDGVFIGNNQQAVDVVLGNNEGDVIHCDADQMRSTDFAAKSVKVQYEYGLFVNLFDTSTSYFRGDLLGNFFDWTKEGTLQAQPSVLANDIAYIYGKYGGVSDDILTLTDNPTVPGGIKMDMKLTFNIHRANWVGVSARIFDGSQYLFIGPNGWTTTLYYFKLRADIYDGEQGNYGKDEIMTGIFSFDLPTDEATYDLQVAITKAGYDPGNYFDGVEDGQVDLYKVELNPQDGNTEFISETHEVINDAVYTTNKSISVLNGEGEFDVYLGTMLKADGTPTAGFVRYGGAEIIPFLTVAAQDIMYQYGRPMNMYEGSVYGYIDPLSKIAITQLSGKFVPVNIKYDYKTNKAQCSLIEIDSTPVPSSTEPIRYKYKPREETSAG